jgi:FkbM family methyltransferase
VSIYAGRVAPWDRIQFFRALRHRAQSIRRVSGLRSKTVMSTTVATEVLPGERNQPTADSIVPVRVKGMDGRVVWRRPRSLDRAAFEFLYKPHHLPPAELTSPIERIAVFGANIGLLAADLASLYPAARLLAVEPDRDNAVLARHNLAHLGERCTLREVAVWSRDQTLTLRWEPDGWGHRVTGPCAPQGTAAAGEQIAAVDAGPVLSDFAGEAPIDYLLVNIETAWYDMLRHGDRAKNVRCLKIQIQDHYDEALPLLEVLGYQARLQRQHWGAFATGTRAASCPRPRRPRRR